MRRSIITSALEVAGVLSIVVGASLAWTPLGFVAAGAAAIGAGWLFGGEPS